MRKCRKCFKLKSRNSFYSRGAARPTELEAVCKHCRLSRMKARGDSLKKEVSCLFCKQVFIPNRIYKYCSSECQRKATNEKRKVWTATHRKRQKFLQKRWGIHNPEKRKSRFCRSHLKIKYGLTNETFAVLKKEQRNKCAICKRKFKGCWVPHVDHKHGLRGTHRGLLCRSCNFCLGFAYENISILKHTIIYLKYWKKRGF